MRKRPVQRGDLVNPKSHNRQRIAWTQTQASGLFTLLPRPDTSRKGRWDKFMFLVKENTSHQPHAKAMPLSRPAAQQGATEGRDSSLSLSGPYRSIDTVRSAHVSPTLTSALSSWGPLLCLPEASRLNWLSCHLPARAGGFCLLDAWPSLRATRDEKVP